MPLIEIGGDVQLMMFPAWETLKGRIISMDYRQAKSSGNPMIVPKIQFEYEGRTFERDAYLVIGGDGAMGFEQFMTACGEEAIGKAYRSPSTAPDFDLDDLIGRVVSFYFTSDGFVKFGSHFSWP